MSAIGAMIHDLDRACFYLVQDMFGDAFAGRAGMLIGSVYFWLPIMAFLLGVLYQSSPRRRLMNIFFAIGSFVLAYQAAALLARLFQRAAPFWMEDIFLLRPRPNILSLDNAFSFPDWAIAALVATFVFTRRRLAQQSVRLHFALALLLLLPMLARVYAGYAYPIDVLCGWLIGFLVGHFMVEFARNLEIVLEERGR